MIAMVLLRPRWQWKLAAAGSLALVTYVASAAAEDWGSVVGLLVVFAMILYCNLAVWRQYVRLEGAVLRQQRTIRPAWPLAAHEIVGITLKRELLRIWLPDGGNRAYSRRWWAGWTSLLAWLEEHCTETGPDGIRRWTVGMNEEMASRLISAPGCGTPGSGASRWPWPSGS
jgi:hypothetical protein